MRNSPFTFAPWLPFLFHHAHWDQTEKSLCPSLGSRPTLAQGPSAHAPLLFGTTFNHLSVQPPRLPPSEDVSKDTFSTWPPPRRHRCAQPPVDVTERLQWLRIWTPIWLLGHWAWLRRGYWRYRKLIDWLIDWWVSFALWFPLCPWFSLFLLADSLGIHLGFGVLRSSPTSTGFAAVLLPVALRTPCTTHWQVCRVLAWWMVSTTVATGLCGLPEGIDWWWTGRGSVHALERCSWGPECFMLTPSSRHNCGAIAFGFC